MSLSENNPSEWFMQYEDEIERLRLDAINKYSFSKLTYIYGRLKKMGPWKQADLNMELIFEIDMMHAAIVTTYGCIFSGGARKVSEKKVPSHLWPIHDKIMTLRNQRYAHSDMHESIDLIATVKPDGAKVVMQTGVEMQMSLGAPPEWQDLFDWLGNHLVDQSRKQLERLTKLSGKEWSMPKGPPPDWI